METLGEGIDIVSCSRNVNVERIREIRGSRKFFLYSARELSGIFESALGKLRDDAVFEEVNPAWQDSELWRKVQDLMEIMHATDLGDLQRKIKLELARSERQFKVTYQPQNGGKELWITL